MARRERAREQDDPTGLPPKPSGGPRLTGIVQRVIGDRGFCFIQADGQDYFCHFTALQDGVQLNDLQEKVTRVSFEVADRGKGPRAERVEVLGL